MESFLISVDILDPSWTRVVLHEINVYEEKAAGKAGVETQQRNEDEQNSRFIRSKLIRYFKV